MAQWRLYKTAHYNYRNTTRPYPLIPQVMNGTGALRQFVPRSLGIAPGRPLAIGQRQCLNDPRCRDIQGSCGGGGCCISDDLISLLPLFCSAGNLGIGLSISEQSLKTASTLLCGDVGAFSITLGENMVDKLICG
jgi:hypothetical protein